jgi:hypothetical protein
MNWGAIVGKWPEPSTMLAASTNGWIYPGTDYAALVIGAADQALAIDSGNAMAAYVLRGVFTQPPAMMAEGPHQRDVCFREASQCGRVTNMGAMRTDRSWPIAEWPLPGDRKRKRTFDGQCQSA